MIRVPYIKVELAYRYHKPEWFHAMIDIASDITMGSAQSHLERFWKVLGKPLQVVVAYGHITKSTKAVFGRFIAIHNTATGTRKIFPLRIVAIQAPEDATYNVLLGVDFLKRIREYCSNHSQIRFHGPCRHWIASAIITNPTMRTTITFKPRCQLGDYPSKTKLKRWQAKPKTPAVRRQQTDLNEHLR